MRRRSLSQEFCGTEDEPDSRFVEFTDYHHVIHVDSALQRPWMNNGWKELLVMAGLGRQGVPCATQISGLPAGTT